MYKRIAILGTEKSFREAVEREAAGKEVILDTVSDAKEIAPGTVAMIATEQQAKEALEAACLIGEEQDKLLNLIADAVACREEIPMGASERVRQHAVRFAQALDYSTAEQHALERGAILRDVGKINIPNDVLLKKSVLTYDEWHMLQSHSALGADLLEGLGLCEDILDMVRQHHESWDGDGYPNHLERKKISRSARILRILDVFCAMTSPRRYRRTVATIEEAIEHLKTERGKHFDPELVDIFIEKEVWKEE